MFVKGFERIKGDGRTIRKGYDMPLQSQLKEGHGEKLVPWWKLAERSKAHSKTTKSTGALVGNEKTDICAACQMH